MLRLIWNVLEWKLLTFSLESSHRRSVRILYRYILCSSGHRKVISDVSCSSVKFKSAVEQEQEGKKRFCDLFLGFASMNFFSIFQFFYYTFFCLFRFLLTFFWFTGRWRRVWLRQEEFEFILIKCKKFVIVKMLEEKFYEISMEFFSLALFVQLELDINRKKRKERNFPS